MFDIGAGEIRGFLPPVFRRQVEILGTNQIAYSAALVGFLNASPEAVEFLLELIGFVEQDRGAGSQIEDGAVGSGYGRVELPAGENVDSPGADCGFDDFFVADDALAAQAGVNCAEQMFADRGFGEWQKQGFVDGV